MQDCCDLKLLFATDYSDSCFRSIRAVAQLADAFRVHVTIAHVGPATRGADRELYAFFAEADHYASCERVRIDGSPAEALGGLAREGGYDMIVAPRSNRLGIPRPLHRSTRCELLSRGRTPLWTISQGLEIADFRRAYRSIAVFVDGRERNLAHVELAASFAARAGAELRILTVVPPVHENALIAYPAMRQPLSADVAVDRIHRLLGGWSLIPTVDVTTGSPARELPRMAARCDADVLFLSEAQSCRGYYFRQFRRAVDHSPCAVVTVPAALPAQFRWSFAAATQVERRERIGLIEERRGITAEDVTRRDGVAGGVGI